MKQTNYRPKGQARKATVQSPTNVAMRDLAKQMMALRMHGQPIPQQMEVEYRQLLAQNYAEMR